MEYPGGVVDGEAENGASAGLEGDAPGQADAVDPFGILDDTKKGVVDASLADEGGLGDCSEENERDKREAGW